MNVENFLKRKVIFLLLFQLMGKYLKNIQNEIASIYLFYGNSNRIYGLFYAMKFYILKFCSAFGEERKFKLSFL
jgi:hypothetical protein